MTFLGIVFVTSTLAVGAGDGVGLWEATTHGLNLLGAGLYPGNGPGPGLTCLGLPAMAGAWLDCPLPVSLPDAGGAIAA